MFIPRFEYTPADSGLFVPDETAAGGWRYIAHPTPQDSEGYEIRVDVFGLRYAYALNS